MSLDIRIDGRTADLAANATLDLALQNPHFDYSKLVGLTASLPNFPLTRRNQYLFGFWEQPQAGGILGRHRLEQYSNGHLIREAQYVLTEASPAGYAGVIVETLGEFFGDWQSEQLSKVDLGTIVVPGVVPAAGIDQDGMKAVVFPTVMTPDYYTTNGAAVSYTGRINDFSGAVNTPARPLVPMVTLKWLLKKIAQATNTTITGDFLEHPVYSNLVLYNTRALDGASSVVVNRHVPDLTPVELVMELRKLFNIRLELDSVYRKMTLGFFEDNIRQAPVIDWSKKVAGRLIKTPEQNRRLQLGYDLDGGDALMKDKPPLLADYLTPGTGSIAALKSKISTLLTDTATGLPKAAQTGNTAQFGQGANGWSPRLLFWQGVAGGVPIAGPSMGGHSLYWNGDGVNDGLWYHHWRGREAMLDEQFYAKVPIMLTETDLALLDWGQKVHINGMNYFVVQIDVSLPIRKAAGCLLVSA